MKSCNSGRLCGRHRRVKHCAMISVNDQVSHRKNGWLRGRAALVKPLKEPKLTGATERIRSLTPRSPRSSSPGFLSEPPRLWQIEENGAINHDLPDAWARGHERGTLASDNCLGALARNGEVIYIAEVCQLWEQERTYLPEVVSLVARERGMNKPSPAVVNVRHNRDAQRPMMCANARPTVPPNRRDLKFRGSDNGAAKFAGQLGYLVSASVSP